MDISGTAYFDPQLDQLSTYYTIGTKPRVYFVVLNENDQVTGGIGIAEFEGISDCAEIQKLYLDDSIKGKGCGRKLMEVAENLAKEAGYRQLYLETHSNLKAAIKLYEKSGYKQIERPKTVLHGTMDHF